MKKLTFIILCLEGALLSFNVAACAALVPSIARDFGLEQFVVGRLIWLYMLPYGAAALLYGPLVRVFDAKKVELVCFLFFSLANLLAAASQNIATLFTARFFMGVFGASVIPLVLIVLGQNIPAADRGKSVGIFFSTTFIASLSGLFLSGIIPWRFIFLIPALAGFALFLIMYRYLPAFPAKEKKFSLNYIAAFKNKAILSLFAYIFSISFFYHGVQQWLGVYFSTSFNLEQFFISMLITLTSLSGIAGEAVGGWLSDSLGRLKTINLGIILMIVSVFILIFKMPVVALAIVMIVWGLGWTLNHAGISTLLTDGPQEFLNEAASLNSGVRFLSGGLGVALSGLIMQRGFSAGLIIFGTGLLGLLFLTTHLFRYSLKEVK